MKYSNLDIDVKMPVIHIQEDDQMHPVSVDLTDIVTKVEIELLCDRAVNHGCQDFEIFYLEVVKTLIYNTRVIYKSEVVSFERLREYMIAVAASLKARCK